MPRRHIIWATVGAALCSGVLLGRFALPQPAPEPEDVHVATFKAGDRVPSEIMTTSNVNLRWSVDAVGLYRDGHWQLMPIFNEAYYSTVIAGRSEDSCLITMKRADEDSPASVDFKHNSISCTSPYAVPESSLSIFNIRMNRSR